MDFAFLLEISFYLVVWVMSTLLHGHSPYFIEILGFVSIVEIFKKYLLPNFEKTEQLNGNLLLLENIEQKQENDSVPIVHSVIVFKICQSLDIKARLAPEGERTPWIPKFKKQLESKQTIPVVKSKIIFEICNALNIKAVLTPTIEQDTAILEPKQKNLHR
ncbi:hypothetical protein TNCV_4198961 [Trichonephila clavipes]|nr:hypothetical protein TNCV_4198961 [Trichonephila clavipes]